VDVWTCEALLNFAQAISEVDAAQGKQYLAEAVRYREDVRKSIERSIALTPLRKLRSGTYHSYSSGACYSRGGHRTGWFGCNYGVEDLNHIVSLVRSLGWSPDDMRLVGALESQEEFCLLGQWARKIVAGRKRIGLPSDEDWFWSRMIVRAQGWSPISDEHLIRDDVVPFLHQCVINYAAMLSPGSGRYGLGATGNETSWFMRNFRNLLVTEMGDTLWLAKATPRHWLEQGKKIAVKNAPTHFGTLAYEIVSDTDNGKINATVEMPSRKAPKEVVLRFRHPKSAPIKSVTVNGPSAGSGQGKPWTEYNKDKETITLKGLTGLVAVTAQY
jgi:hypothetical protein